MPRLAIARIAHARDPTGVLKADGLTLTGTQRQTVLHPAISELRQQQLAFGRLTDLLRLPEDLSAAERARSSQGRRAAAARWESPVRAVGVR